MIAARQVDPDHSKRSGGGTIGPHRLDGQAVNLPTRAVTDVAGTAGIQPATAHLAVDRHDLPARLDRIFQAIETGGLEVHVRAAQVDAVVARTERLANRVAASVLAAAVIEGLVQLESRRRRHRPPLPWRRKSATANRRAFVPILRRRS